MSAPWQETFADAGDGDGEGEIGTNICPIHPQYKIFIGFSMIHRFFVNCFVKAIEHHQKYICFIWLPPGRRLLLTLGMGMGGRGANRDQYLFHPSPNISFLCFPTTHLWLLKFTLIKIIEKCNVEDSSALIHERKRDCHAPVVYIVGACA